MRTEHHALKQVGALSIQESTFYQANMIQQVLSQQADLQDNLQASIDQQVKESLLVALSDFTATTESSQEASMNNVSTAPSNTTTTTLLQMIEKLSTKVDELKRQSTNKDINPRTGKKFKRYCWTCGCCPHWGKD